jgi:hypothetical protein
LRQRPCDHLHDETLIADILEELKVPFWFAKYWARHEHISADYAAALEELLLEQGQNLGASEHPY